MKHSGAENFFYGQDLSKMDSPLGAEFVPDFSSDSEADRYAWEKMEELFRLLVDERVNSGTLKKSENGVQVLSKTAPLVLDVSAPSESLSGSIQDGLWFLLRVDDEGQPTFCLEVHGTARTSEPRNVIYSGRSVTRMCYTAQEYLTGQGFFSPPLPSVLDIIVSAQRMLQKAKA